MSRHVYDRDRISISLKTSAITAFHRSTNTIWSFDRAGRPLGHFYQGRTFRRTLDNRWFEKSRKMYHGETFRTVIPTGSAPILSRLAGLQSRLVRLDTYDTAEVQNVISRIGRLTPESLETDGQSFCRLYSPIGILPPDQYRALVIQISEGCHYNRCTFCSLYQDIPLRIKTTDEIETHALAIKSFFREGLSYRNSIFLGDANALITPMNVLVPAIKQIRRVFPEIAVFTAFMDVFTGYKKNSRYFTALFKLGLKRLYLGIESGAEPVLQVINKNYDRSAVIRTVKAIKSSGISCNLIFLMGAWPEELDAVHRSETVSLVKRLPLDQQDIIFLSEYQSSTETEPNDEFLRIRRQTTALKTALMRESERRVQVAPYDINQFLY